MQKVVAKAQQESEPYWWYFRGTKTLRGTLMKLKRNKATPVPKHNDWCDEYVIVPWSLDSVSHWVTSPKLSTKQKKFKFLMWAKVALLWCDCYRLPSLSIARHKDAEPMELEWDKVLVPRKEHKDKEMARKELDFYYKRGSRCEREVRWSSGEYDHSKIIPEKQKSSIIKSLYIIYRPEASVWSVHIPLKTRKKKRGEGETSDEVKVFSRSVAQGAFMNTRLRLVDLEPTLCDFFW